MSSEDALRIVLDFAKRDRLEKAGPFEAQRKTADPRERVEDGEFRQNKSPWRGSSGSTRPIKSQTIIGFPRLFLRTPT